jgi:choline kinase/thiamine kinase-like enzyme
MKVFIPTAGIGSRLGGLTKHFNKAMIPIGEKPVISHVVETYPSDTEYVVALGYKGSHIKQYLKLAYPDRKFSFVKIDNYNGPQSGLGHTLKQCRQHLNQPFFFHANDTIVDNEYVSKKFTQNTLFLKKGASHPKIYRTASITQGKKIAKIYDKTDKQLENVHDYIGLAYIKDFKKFNNFLDQINVQVGESDFFMKNPQVNLDSYFVKYWYDIGNIDQLRIAKKKLGDSSNLDKPDEAVYFIDSRVIKFSTKPSFISNRIKRANLLHGFVPKIINHTKNFYVYNYVPGELLSKATDASDNLRQFLGWANKSIWKSPTLTPKDQSDFESLCFNFYYEKTLDRLNLFYDRFDFVEKDQNINGIKSPSLANVINQVNWSSLKQGIPVLFHGDLHFENIIKTDSTFTLLDWRQDFGGQTKYGDIYYDLAKLLHGFIINHQIIKDEHYSINSSHQDSKIEFDFHRKHNSLECEKILKEFVIEQGYSWEKVQILTVLIFLNIAGLHHRPYSHLLYHLGKQSLVKLINISNDK